MTGAATVPRARGVGVLLIAVTLCVLGRVCLADFVGWDDASLILQNPHLNPPTLGGLAWHWTHAHEDMYIPVVYTAWWTLSALTGKPDPVLFHTANLAVHVCSVWLVFLILRLMAMRPWPAAAGALLFAIHPLQVEPVAWATGMKDLLAGLFSLAALWAYLQFVRRRAWPLYAAATTCFLLALLAKPSAVTLPLIAATLQCLLPPRQRQAAPTRRALIWLCPWLLAAIVVTVIATHAQTMPATDFTSVSPPARILVAADALAFYLYKLFWPLLLAINYGRTPDSVLNPSWHHLAPAWITWIVPAALASAAALARVRELTAAALIFFFALLPVLGLHPFVFQLYSTVADRYVYLAMLGPALALSWACNRFPAPAVLLAAVAGLACCSAISFRQAGRWHDTASLCRQAVLVNPRDYRAYHNLGLYLADRGDVLGAMNAYQKVIDLKPQAVAEYRYVADAKAAAADFNGALDYAGRLIDLQSALIPADRGDPGELHRWRAGIYLQSARAAGSGSAQAQTAYRNAVDDCDESLRRNPGDASAAAERAAALAGLRDMGVAP